MAQTKTDKIISSLLSKFKKNTIHDSQHKNWCPSTHGRTSKA